MNTEDLSVVQIVLDFVFLLYILNVKRFYPIKHLRCLFCFVRFTIIYDKNYFVCLFFFGSYKFGFINQLSGDM